MENLYMGTASKKNDFPTASIYPLMVALELKMGAHAPPLPTLEFGMVWCACKSWFLIYEQREFTR